MRSRAFESAHQALGALLEFLRAHFADQKHDAVVDDDDDVVLEREFLVLVETVVSAEVDALVVDVRAGAAPVVRGARARGDSDDGDRATAEQRRRDDEDRSGKRIGDMHETSLSRLRRRCAANRATARRESSLIASTSKRHVASARRGCSARNALAARTSLARLPAFTESMPSPKRPLRRKRTSTKTTISRSRITRSISP